MNDVVFPGFSLEANGKLLNDGDFRAAGNAREIRSSAEDGETRALPFRHERFGLEVKRFVTTFPDLDVVEAWIELRNGSDRDLRISRVDSVRGVLPPDEYVLRHFSSGWGQEFTPHETPLKGTRILEGTAGRSSREVHPWFALEGKSGHTIVGAIAWSGNWIVRFEPTADARYVLSAGLSNWQFHKTLRPGESMEGIRILYVARPAAGLEEACVQLARWGRHHGYAHNALSRSVPVEWNHWWPYEDAEIDEKVFKANAELAAKLGIEVCTLDAGWFGGGAVGENNWYHVRGDWDHVNRTRFPAGLAALSEDVRGRGLKFGLWCEIEAVGKDAQLAKAHPEYLATRNGKSIGYVCMGNPATVDWAFDTLDRLIREYGLSWIKLDFNLDPGAGCDRSDHGHGPGDGLYEHYRGYYRLLDRVRAAHPDVLLENCSSGGLRIDLGILRHLHATFLSDPDYTEHALQLLWGATRMIHPSALLRWSWSQTCFRHGENVVNDPYTPDAPMHKFDYMIRAAMIGAFGCSLRLPDLPARFRDRLGEHVAFYKKHVRDLVRDGDTYVLTGQAQRKGKGDRWNGFLTVSPDKRNALLFVFRLTGGEETRTLSLKGLDPSLLYAATFTDKEMTAKQSGATLMSEGLAFAEMPEESAEVVLLQAR